MSENYWGRNAVELHYADCQHPVNCVEFLKVSVIADNAVSSTCIQTKPPNTGFSLATNNGTI
jgi:hypothetical protein